MLSASCRPLAGIVLFTLLSLSASCPPDSASAWSGQQGSPSGPKYKQPSETAWPGVSQSYLYFAGGPFRSKLSPTAPLWHHTCTLPFFVGANSEALWQAFLSFLTGLGFLQRWTATMEKAPTHRKRDASISMFLQSSSSRLTGHRWSWSTPGCFVKQQLQRQSSKRVRYGTPFARPPGLQCSQPRPAGQEPPPP